MLYILLLLVFNAYAAQSLSPPDWEMLKKVAEAQIVQSQRISHYTENPCTKQEISTHIELVKRILENPSEKSVQIEFHIKHALRAWLNRYRFDGTALIPHQPSLSHWCMYQAEALLQKLPQQNPLHTRMQELTGLQNKLYPLLNKNILHALSPEHPIEIAEVAANTRSEEHIAWHTHYNCHKEELWQMFLTTYLERFNEEFPKE